jgi:hypothetical protein
MSIQRRSMIFGRERGGQPCRELPSVPFQVPNRRGDTPVRFWPLAPATPNLCCWEHRRKTSGDCPTLALPGTYRLVPAASRLRSGQGVQTAGAIPCGPSFSNDAPATTIRAVVPELGRFASRDAGMNSSRPPAAGQPAPGEPTAPYVPDRFPQANECHAVD